jgi:DNA repair protein RecN (Recombination protein N)
MLRRIRIHNHALIQEVELHLDEGFHVFTGETGSGKSILLGAVGLLLGDRADSSGVGLHGDRAVIEGDFSAPQLEEWLSGEELPHGARITVRREVLRNGRSRVFINDAQASVGQLRALGSHLVDIHRQDHAGVVLERPALCDLLDQAGGHAKERSMYLEAFGHWTETKAELERLRAQAQAPSGDVDYLSHQLQELERLNLARLDWDALQAELNTLQHASELHAGLQAASHHCDSEEGGAVDAVARAWKSLTALEGVDAEVDEVLARLQSLRVELQDLASTLEDLLDQKQPDPQRLERLSMQYDQAMRAMRKHNVDTPAELQQVEHDLADQIAAVQGLDQALVEAADQEAAAKRDMHEAWQALSAARQRAALRLTDAVLPLLGRLKMPHAQMGWEWPACHPDAHGMDTPEVWFSSNPGSPLLPLTKVASGGERARFMLALKSVLAGIQSTPVVILDEIDTGVSGEVASHMGKAMRDIAASNQTQQVLAVTHLPQVAALASKHWEVSKFTDGANTHVTVEPLDSDGRQRAIASMLSGSDITQEALGQAARLLASS